MCLQKTDSDYALPCRYKLHVRFLNPFPKPQQRVWSFYYTFTTVAKRWKGLFSIQDHLLISRKKLNGFNFMIMYFLCLSSYLSQRGEDLSVFPKLKTLPMLNVPFRLKLNFIPPVTPPPPPTGTNNHPVHPFQMYWKKANEKTQKSKQIPSLCIDLSINSLL